MMKNEQELAQPERWREPTTITYKAWPRTERAVGLAVHSTERAVHVSIGAALAEHAKFSTEQGLLPFVPYVRCQPCTQPVYRIQPVKKDGEAQGGEPCLLDIVKSVHSLWWTKASIAEDLEGIRWRDLRLSPDAGCFSRVPFPKWGDAGYDTESTLLARLFELDKESPDKLSTPTAYRDAARLMETHPELVFSTYLQAWLRKEMPRNFGPPKPDTPLRMLEFLQLVPQLMYMEGCGEDRECAAVPPEVVISRHEAIIEAIRAFRALETSRHVEEPSQTDLRRAVYVQLSGESAGNPENARKRAEQELQRARRHYRSPWGVGDIRTKIASGYPTTLPVATKLFHSRGKLLDVRGRLDRWIRSPEAWPVFEVLCRGRSPSDLMIFYDYYADLGGLVATLQKQAEGGVAGKAGSRKQVAAPEATAAEQSTGEQEHQPDWLHPEFGIDDDRESLIKM